MRIVGPERFTLSIEPDRCGVMCSRGKPKFSGLASGNKPKLYIASHRGMPIYVGQTVRTMGSRLRLGFKAKGKGGYYGYAWRHHLESADLDIWRHEDGPEGKARGRDMETVEAEIVFLLRQRTGKWPQFQTEIHFYQSTNEHRQIAEQIVCHYQLT